MNATYDVIVVGLGGMGSSAAYHLARRGHRVLGLEQFTPAHSRGSSHGGSRIVRQAYFEDAAYVPLLLRSYQLWDELNSAAEHEVFTRTGGLYVGPPQSEVVAGSLAAARAYDLGHLGLDATELKKRYSQLAVSDTDVAMLEYDAGLARPELTVSTHLQLAGKAGAELHFEEAVLGFTENGEAVQVQTANATYTGAKLVVTAGAWAAKLLHDLGIPLVVERQVQFWFDPGEHIDRFAVGEFPIFIWEGADGLQLYGFPAIDGPDGGVKVAFYRRGRPTDPDQLDTVVGEQEVGFIRDYLSSRIPELGSFLRAQACLYTNSPDLNFVIGPYAESDRVTIAAGFSGHGFKFVPVVGEILADLCESGRTTHPIELFDPTRFG